MQFYATKNLCDWDNDLKKKDPNQSCLLYRDVLHHNVLFADYLSRASTIQYY